MISMNKKMCSQVTTQVTETSAACLGMLFCMAKIMGKG